jgi:hypothetical protein
MKIGRVAFGICFFLAMGRTASADAGLSNFSHLAGEQSAADDKRLAAPRKRKSLPAIDRVILGSQFIRITCL